MRTGIAVDSSGDAYVTAGPNRAILDQERVRQHPGRLTGCFVSKFDLTQSGNASLIYSTYLGGTDNTAQRERGEDIAVDSSGNVSVTGSTDASDFDIGTNYYDNTSSGDKDASSAQFDATGASLLYSTYLGQTAASAMIRATALPSTAPECCTSPV